MIEKQLLDVIFTKGMFGEYTADEIAEWIKSDYTPNPMEFFLKNSLVGINY